MKSANNYDDQKLFKEENRELFFKISNQQYAALRKDKNAWQEYMQELKDWDSTLNDGIDDH